MILIELTTNINATVDICFNLSRSVELHKISTAKTNEEVIAGRMTGLFELGDTVTWKARHFSFYQTLPMEISDMIVPNFFEDKMIKGIFKSISHKHYFNPKGKATVMQDLFAYEVPFGLAGKVFNSLVLKNYMTKLLTGRNNTIKHYAETGKWKEIIMCNI